MPIKWVRGLNLIKNKNLWGMTFEGYTIGVSQNQMCKITPIKCDRSRKKTFKVEKMRDRPKVNNNCNRIRGGSRRKQILGGWPRRVKRTVNSPNPIIKFRVAVTTIWATKISLGKNTLFIKFD